MNAIIDHTTPLQRALLYTALQNMQDTCNRGITSATETTQKNMLQQFFFDTKKECQLLTALLLSECSIDDLDYADQYAKHQKLSALNTEFSAEKPTGVLE